jgi:hypothetical protein
MSNESRTLRTDLAMAVLEHAHEELLAADAAVQRAREILLGAVMAAHATGLSREDTHVQLAATFLVLGDVNRTVSPESREAIRHALDLVYGTGTTP